MLGPLPVLLLLLLLLMLLLMLMVYADPLVNADAYVDVMLLAMQLAQPV